MRKIKHYDANGKLKGYTEEPDDMFNRLLRIDLWYCYIVWGIYAVIAIPIIFCIIMRWPKDF